MGGVDFPRPSPFTITDVHMDPLKDRYREIRRWYARDQGRSTFDEVAALIERPASVRAA